jgi:molecular chaperone GrpE
MSESVESSAPDQPTPPPAESPADPRLAQLERDLEVARARVNDLARAYQAAEADREAFKQRLQREREQLLDVERGKVALTLLETLDELDLCLAAAAESPLAKGVRLIREGLLRKLDATGIERVALEGTPYDPNLAEATDLVLTTAPEEDGQVLAVVRPCYRFKGKVLRPGRVRVARFLKPAEA